MKPTLDCVECVEFVGRGWGRRGEDKESLLSVHFPLFFCWEQETEIQKIRKVPLELVEENGVCAFDPQASACLSPQPNHEKVLSSSLFKSKKST